MNFPNPYAGLEGFSQAQSDGLEATSKPSGILWDNTRNLYIDAVTGLAHHDQSGHGARDPIVSMFHEPAEPKTSLMDIFGVEQLLSNVEFESNHALLEVFNGFGQDLDITPRWAMNLKKYVYGFTTKNEQYAEFFGSPYLGIYRIVFTSADRNEWFSEIFDVDEEELKENLYATAAVNKNWNVTSDVFNLSIPYLLYRVNKSDLSHDIKRQAMIDIVSMYHYKCLTSIMVNDYKYLAKKELAMETYNRLSLRYDIKRYGSWRALIQARAEFIIDPRTGIHYQTFTKMNDDKKIIYMVGDIQDRLRGVINDINKVFHQVKNQMNIVKIEKGTVALEDGTAIKEISKQVNLYKNYIVNVLTSKTGFYKEELVRYAAEAIPNTPQDKLDRIIRVFPDQYNAEKGKTYRDFVEEVVIHLFEYVSANGIRFTDLRDVLRKMKGAYLAQRSQNQSVILMRDTGDDIVKTLTGIRTKNKITSLRTSLMLYIVLRTLTKDSYS